ncbi:zonadhesin-like protein [Lates japonicus]|uniref:Zonadhesin-like protein n=1 Tax=Lates japonicus TaxID=270547 RepID=A0AAD3R5X6_LATJO|nr:zonadhesin-like protein [Lates japonicus]
MIREVHESYCTCSAASLANVKRPPQLLRKKAPVLLILIGPHRRRFRPAIDPHFSMFPPFSDHQRQLSPPAGRAGPARVRFLIVRWEERGRRRRGLGE